MSDEINDLNDESVPRDTPPVSDPPVIEDEEVDVSEAIAQLSQAATNGELGGEVTLNEESSAEEEETEDPSPAEPETPPYAGEYKPMPAVEMAVPITEEGTFEKLGFLNLSNYEPDELETLRRLVTAGIVRQQSARNAVVEEAQRTRTRHPYLSARINEDTLLYLTEEERDQMQVLGIYKQSLRLGAGTYGLFEDEADGWTNLPREGDKKIAIGATNHAKSADPIVRIRGKLNLTLPFAAPLWSSGLHLKIDGPGVLDQLSLETRLLMEKVDMGRESSGFVYSASSVYLNRHVIDFILGLVSSSTAGTTDPHVLKSLILLTDLEPMVLAAAASIWPDGYNLERPCINLGKGCTGVVRKKIYPRRMLMVRKRKLSDAQFQLMTKRNGFVDHDVIRNYQRSMRPEVSRYIPLKNGLALKLYVPTLADYDRVAGAWMERLDHKARMLIGSNASEQDRQVYLARANNISLIMAFAHWVDGVVEFDSEMDTEPKVLLSRSEQDEDDPEARRKTDLQVDQILEDFSTDPELVLQVVTGIETFINAMTIAAVVVDKTRCPECGLPTAGDEQSKHPHLVNINPIELFFTLLRHKILQAGA